MNHEAWNVFWYAMITAIATGLGAIPFMFIKKITPTVMGVSNAIAAGLMTGASIGLIMEAQKYSYSKMLLGLIIGVVFVIITEFIINHLEKHKREEPDFLVNKESFFKSMKGAILLIVVMTAHSAAEGIGVGTSFGNTKQFGLIITFAIAIQNIPEGLAISASLVSKGVPWWKAGLWSIFTSLPQPIFAVPAFLFVSTMKEYLPIGLGFAAGAMFWVVFSDIVPESQENISRSRSATIIMLGVIAMLYLEYAL